MGALQLKIVIGIGLAIYAITPACAQIKSSPKDTAPKFRPAIPGDTAGPPRGPLFGPALTPLATSVIRIVDTVVSNTNPNLQNTDTFPNGETSIAINPLNPNEIVISAFSSSWGLNAALWHSTNDGQTWTKVFTVPVPPGATGTLNCPCDQTYDYGPNNVLFGSVLTNTLNIFTGSTTNPTNAASWSYFTPTLGNAQPTNQSAPNNSDQPWMLHNRGTANANSQNVFVAYGTNPRVATSINNVPPQFAAGSDPVVGTASGQINPGHRLATDPRNGWVYSLHQNCLNASPANCASEAADPKNIQYFLNRSTDQGVTWTLNGQTAGIVVATANSTQPLPKFGTVNALLGGVVHGAVDPTNGDLYYVYGNRDAGGNNRLAIRRVTDNGAGGVNIGGEVFVVGGTVQAALPQVAVNNQGVVAVFYYTYNGMVATFPQFTTWLATSTDQGATFTTQQLSTVLSPVNDDLLDSTNPANSCQRVWGDYVQMKSLNDCFYGSFVANRAAFGGPFANPDPIFFKACTLAHFSAFSAVLTEYPNVPEFSIISRFTLAAGSNGINPATEQVTLQIGNFTTTIPPGSFVLSSPGTYTFVGVINGVNLTLQIKNSSGNDFIFGAIGKNVNLTTINPAGPVGLTLTIGDDNGTATVNPIINNATP
jgi:hypothetical protein